jgi:hypothetical protein
MAGILSFTLGLEASSFLRNIGLSAGHVLSLSGAMMGLEKIGHHAFSAIEEGGRLFGLSMRTGESVKNLWRLQEAFKIVGLSSDQVAPMIKRLQVALAGMDENGQRTEGIFEALGVDMEALKTLDTPAQFQKLAEAIGKLSKEQAAFAASKLFGREGGGSLLQLARGAEDFHQALRDTAKDALIWQAAAGVFDKISGTISLIAGKLRTMWAGVALGAAPAIQAILDFVKKIDFGEIGKQIGMVLNTLFTILTSGEALDFFKTAFLAALETIGNFGFKVFNGLIAFIVERFTWLAQALPQIFIGLFQALGHALAGMVKLQLANVLKDAANIASFFGKPQWAGEIYDQALGLTEGAKGSFRGAGRYLGKVFDKVIPENINNMGEAMTKGLEAFGSTGNIFGTKNTDKLKDQWMKNWLKAHGLFADSSKPGEGGEIDLATGKKSKMEVTDWEKMGLVIGGLGLGFQEDHARTTAQSTKGSHDELKKMNEKLSKLKGFGDFTNHK